MGPFPDDLDLVAALASVAESGAAFVPGALGEHFRAQVLGEVAAGPVRPYRERFGQVRQQIEGFDVFAPFGGYPEITRLCRALTSLARRDGRSIRGLATWVANEAGVVVYREGSIGITPHLDGKRYRRLVAIVTLSGRAELAVCRSRAGEVVTAFESGPGDLVLLRGPGLAGARDGRPFHAVGTPRGGERWAVGVRMSTGTAS